MVVYVGYEAINSPVKDGECGAAEARYASARARYLGIQQVLRGKTIRIATFTVGRGATDLDACHGKLEFFQPLQVQLGHDDATVLVRSFLHVDLASVKQILDGLRQDFA
jgi:hypothetical protein